MINPVNSLEVEDFSLLGSLPSKGMKKEGRIDGVVSLTFRCNVLQSEEYFCRFF